MPSIYSLGRQVERAVQRVLRDIRPEQLSVSKSKPVAETILRRALAKLIKKEPARALFDGERKREERQLRKGGTRG